MLLRGVFLTHFKWEYRHTLISKQECFEIQSVCAPTLLRPVGRKCPPGTPTIAALPYCYGQRFIRPRLAANRLSRQAAAFLACRGAPAPLRLAVPTHWFYFIAGVPAPRGKGSLPLTTHVFTLCQGSLLHNSTLTRAVCCCSTPRLPPHAMPRCSSVGGLLRPKPLWWFVGLLLCRRPPTLFRDTPRAWFVLALVFVNHSSRPRHSWQGSARLCIMAGCFFRSALPQSLVFFLADKGLWCGAKVSKHRFYYYRTFVLDKPYRLW